MIEITSGAHFLFLNRQFSLSKRIKTSPNIIAILDVRKNTTDIPFTFMYYKNQILLDNPIAYWSLNGLTDNIGTLGSLVDGIYSGSPTTISGLIADGDSAMDFDGIDDGILIPNNSSINTGESYSQKTIELTFNADQVTGRQILYEQGNIENGINIHLEDNELNLGVWTNNSGERCV